MELEEDNISTISHNGKMHLGGEDFDNILLDYCIEKFKKQFKIDLNKDEYIREKIRLRKKCEMIKRELSVKDEAELEVESLAEKKDLILKITRAYFENLCKEKFDECFVPIKKILGENNENIKNIEQIILVGGSTRIPKIQEDIKNFFLVNYGKNININIKLNPDEAVAYGATIEAALEMGKFSEDITLLDVIPFSLGVAINRNKMFKYFEKGSKFPCKKTFPFVPGGSSGVIGIEIYEGENEYVKYNYPLGKMEFYIGDFHKINYEERKRDKKNFNDWQPYIDITFDLNSDSILTVTAETRYNKKKLSLVIQNDKSQLSKEDKEQEQKYKRENKSNNNSNLKEKMRKEKNYKFEIFDLVNKIKESKNNSEKVLYLKSLEEIIEKFINTFKKEEDSFFFKRKDEDKEPISMYYEKMYFYLNYLFTAYSNLLLLENKNKEKIINNIKEYLKIFSENHTSYCPSLVNIFANNDNKLFVELFIQILGYYSQRGLEYLYKYKENLKYSKHIFEECLSIIKK